MLSFDQPSWTMRLKGQWRVRPMPLTEGELPAANIFEESYRIPECANLQWEIFPDRPYWGPHLRAMNEQAWVYHKTFLVPDDVVYERARLRFEGVDYFADVWLNDQQVGGHEGSFASFTLDVTDALRPGEENTLMVRVSSPWDKPNKKGNYPINHVLRGLVKGQYEHGEGVIPPNVNPIGIWRPVHLLLDHGISVNRVRTYTELDGTVRIVGVVMNTRSEVWTGECHIAVTADNHDGPGVNLATAIEIPPGEHEIEHELQVPDPRWWWPWDHGKPNLYKLKGSLQRDGDVFSTCETTFGIRTIRLDRAPDRFTWWINDRAVFLRGSSYMPGLYMANVTEQSVANDVELALYANLNLLRVHVHVSPQEVYAACDRAGIMIWQDFELNWVQDPSIAFERRALILQRAMIDTYFNHPSVITWTCHNEPTMVFAHRENYEQHPDPVLYADACEQDTTRPIFICSGQMEDNWQQAGDIHTYYGAIMSRDYTDVYKHQMNMNTEFGFEAPADIMTLKAYPDAWRRLNHLDGKVKALWAYQAELIQFHVEHLRRTRVGGSAGFVHFWLVDLVPQVGCGVLDVNRLPKGGFEALKNASKPLHIALEHDGKKIYALWIFNDTPITYDDMIVRWQVNGPEGETLIEGEMPFSVKANASQKVMAVDWAVSAAQCAEVQLVLVNAHGGELTSNIYSHPLQPSDRPKGYPWKFDSYLGYKVFDRADAVSLVDQGSSGIIKLIPLAMREAIAEWGMRQKLPLGVLSFINKISRPFVNG